MTSPNNRTASRKSPLEEENVTWHATEPWTKFGMHVVIWLFGGFVLFTSFVSIAGAIVATGTVTVESRYQAVQHRDGGIVKKILVSNGDRVAAGDVLIELDDTTTKATRDVVAQRVNDLEIQEARLTAERDRKDDFALPAGTDPEKQQTKKLIRSQRSLFKARRAAHMGEISVLTQRLGQLQREITGLRSQLAARKKEYAINSEELAAVMPLFERGYVNQQRIAPLKREAARLEGERGRLEAQIAKMDGVISETELRIAQTKKEFTQQVVDELQRVQANLAEQRESLKAQADTLARVQIRAPQAGIVHALSVNTEGGVITPASTIAQIVPEGDNLQVEARLEPRDIDKVRPGQTAVINFTAFNARTTPRLDGSVIKVSAAELLNERGTPYFTAQIEIPATELPKLGSGRRLLPGMPADVFIETQSRSILSYFLRPLTDAMSRAMREE